MKNQSLTGTYKKPINIFEAITKRSLENHVSASELSFTKEKKDVHQSEFLFPIRMLF